MKKLDFSYNGGLPLTQNRLAFLQQAWTEAIQGIVAQGGSGPFVLSGAVITRVSAGGSNYDYSITDGWIWYEGNLIRVAAMGPVTIDESVNIAMLVLTPVASTLTYNDTSTPTVIDDVTIGIASFAIGTGDDAGKFAYNHLVTYGKDSARGHIAVATGSGAGTVTGDIYYRKNFVNNTVEIDINVITASPSDCGAQPLVLPVTLGHLPVGYRPPGNRIFNAGAYNVSFTLVKDAVGNYISNLIGQVITGSGAVVINFVKPDAGVGSYWVSAALVMSLD